MPEEELPEPVNAVSHDLSHYYSLNLDLLRQALLTVLAEENLPDPFTPESIAVFMDAQADRVDQRPIDCMQVSVTFAEGRWAINRAAKVLGFPIQRFPPGEGDADTAIRLWMMSQSDVAAKEVLDRAHYFIASKNRKQGHDFFGKTAKASQGLNDERLGQVSAAVKQGLKFLGLHQFLQIKLWPSQNSHGWILTLLHGGHFVQKAVVPNKGPVTRLGYRPARSDLVRYDQRHGRLTIIAGDEDLIAHYRRIFGDVLFGDPLWFSNNRACNLDLLRKGRSILNWAGCANIAHVELVGCVWRKHDRLRVTFRGPDTFADLESRSDLGEGVFEEATFDVHLKMAREGRRKQTVTLIHPHTAEFDRGVHEQEISRVLEHIGIYGRPPPLPGAPIRDLWSLYPWRMTRTQWMEAYGDDVLDWYPDLLAKAELVEIEHQGPEGEERLAVQRLPGNRVLGISQDSSIGDRELTISDIDALELRISHQLEILAGSLGLDPALTTYDSSGYADLGARDFHGGHRIHVFVLTRDPRERRDALLHSLRLRANVARPVIIVPKARASAFAGIEGVVPWQLPDPMPKGLMEAIIGNLGWKRHIPAWEWMECDLIMHKGFGVRLYGQPLTGMSEGSQEYRFLEQLAMSPWKEVPIAELEIAVTEKSDDPAVTTQVASRLKGLIRRRVKAAGLTNDKAEIVQKKYKGGYRLALDAEVIDAA